MTELIALLMMTFGQLLGTGVSDVDIAAAVRKAVLDDPPVAMEDMELILGREKPEEGDQAPATGELPYVLEFKFTRIFIEPMFVEQLTMRVGGVTSAPNGGLSIGSLWFSAELSEDDLTGTLAPQAEQLPDLEIKIAPEAITLSGKCAILLAEVPFEVKGMLGLENDTELAFRIDATMMAGIKLPQGVSGIIEGQVNPVFDFVAFADRSEKDFELIKEHLHYEFNLVVDELTSEEGHIIVVGRA